ncbi:hypothetical protein HDU85_006875 [Gaertneriomyces sp. JEL0708]|nr:hypothetical protein HDU85_006875 [Gaertneriomyces sp. JEL0708]
MKATRTNKKSSSPEQYIHNILKGTRPLKAVNFYKYFGHTDRVGAESQLRSNLESIAAHASGKVPVAASNILHRWESLVRNPTTCEYWKRFKRTTEKAERKAHQNVLREQAARQQRALGEVITRQVEEECNPFIAGPVPLAVEECDPVPTSPSPSHHEREVHHPKTNGTFLFSLPGATTDTPNKPKVLSQDIETLRGTVQLALTSTVGRSNQQLPADVCALYQKYRNDARRCASLAQHPQSSELIRRLLSQDHKWQHWDDIVCALVLPACEDDDKLFFQIARLGLLKCFETLGPGSHRTTHERTTFIDKVIPWLSPLRLTQSVDWLWCEHQYVARAEGHQHERNYETVPMKMADGLGLHPANGHEIMMIECNGGNTTEKVAHNMSDTLKLVENSIIALKNCFSSWKEASFEKMQKVSVLAIHSIKDRLCLTETRVSKDGQQWQVIEVRNALTPTTWADMAYALGVLEMVATIKLHFAEQKCILNQVKKEHTGLLPLEDGQKTVRQVLWSGSSVLFTDDEE